MPLDKSGKYHLNPMDMKDDAPEKPAVGEPDGDEQPAEDGVHIHITKGEKGYHSKIENGDELGPDEQDHGSLSEAHAASAKALEEKFGEAVVEKAEEEISPGIHKKVEQKLEGGSSILGGLKR